MIVICFGITKSGSTLAFEMTKGILASAGHSQERLASSMIEEGHSINFVNLITAEKLDALVALTGPRKIVAIKTHSGFSPNLRSYLARAIAAGDVRVQASFRDPREICLSLVDAGKNARAAGRRPFSNIVTMDDAVAACLRQIGHFRKWGAMPQALRLYYDTVAFETDKAISQVEAQLGVTADRSAVLHHMFNTAFTQKNKAVRDRYKDELTVRQNEQLESVFGVFLRRACRMNDQTWFDAAIGKRPTPA